MGLQNPVNPAKSCKSCPIPLREKKFLSILSHHSTGEKNPVNPEKSCKSCPIPLREKKFLSILSHHSTQKNPVDPAKSCKSCPTTLRKKILSILQNPANSVPSLYAKKSCRSCKILQILSHHSTGKKILSKFKNPVDPVLLVFDLARFFENTSPERA